MAINYVEKGQGLHDAIAAAGHWLKQQSNGIWVSSNDVAVQAIIDNYPLDNCKAELKSRIDEHAKKLRDSVVSVYSSGEMASWPVKRGEALAYQASSNAADAPILSAEATARGETLQSIVDRVLANASSLSTIEAQISGVAGLHKDAVTAKTTFSEVVYYDYSAGWPL